MATVEAATAAVGTAVERVEVAVEAGATGAATEVGTAGVKVVAETAAAETAEVATAAEVMAAETGEVGMAAGTAVPHSPHPHSNGPHGLPPRGRSCNLRYHPRGPPRDAPAAQGWTCRCTASPTMAPRLQKPCCRTSGFQRLVRTQW